MALEAIKDISKHWLSRSFSIENDWNMRLKALTRIQQIVLQIAQQEESLGGLLQPTLIKLVDPLNNQFGDLRSQIIREVTRLIVLIAQIPQMTQQEDTVDIVE